MTPFSQRWMSTCCGTPRPSRTATATVTTVARSTIAAAATPPKGVAMPDRIERKLTTILAADVEGYSRLMAADEVAAMDRMAANAWGG